MITIGRYNMARTKNADNKSIKEETDLAMEVDLSKGGKAQRKTITISLESDTIDYF